MSQRRGFLHFTAFFILVLICTSLHDRVIFNQRAQKWKIYWVSARHSSLVDTVLLSWIKLTCASYLRVRSSDDSGEDSCTGLVPACTVFVDDDE